VTAWGQTVLSGAKVREFQRLEQRTAQAEAEASECATSELFQTTLVKGRHPKGNARRRGDGRKKLKIVWKKKWGPRGGKGLERDSG